MRPEGAVALVVGTATGAKLIDHRRANHVRLDPCTQCRTGSLPCSLRWPRPIGADDPAPPNRNCRAACGLTVGCATGTACAFGRHSNRGGSADPSPAVQLGITEAQMPLWTAFAQAMRDNAASTDALFAQRAHAVTSMTAVDNMHSYAQIARAYADNTERLATAFDSLYASLTDTQKQAADTLFREQASAAAQPRTRR
jgi:cytochrome c551/c552